MCEQQHSFILSTALICFCTQTLVVAYSQTKHNIHNHCCLKKINYIFVFLLLFSFLEFAHPSFSALLFSLSISCCVCAAHSLNSLWQKPLKHAKLSFKYCPYTMFAPVTSHAIILSITRQMYTNKMCNIS